MSIPKLFTDGLTSLTNKLANRRNAHATNRMTFSRVDWDELRAIYKTGVGSKIIRVKSGIALNDTLQFDSTGDKEYYEARLQQHVKNACKYMLAFGRGLIVIQEPGADLSQPLPAINDWAKVNYQVFSGDMVYVQSIEYNLSSPNYYKPRAYSVRGFTIHPSRVVDMTYVQPVEFDAPEYFFGGISEFELIRNELVSDQIVQRAVPAILEKSSTLFYKVKGLWELLADQKSTELFEYLSQLENLRSIYGAGVADKEDEIETHIQALSNLAESDMITLRRLAMVTGLSLSTLVGEPPKGLSASGEGDRQVDMQTIKGLQSEYLLDKINRLMAMHGRGAVWFKENQGQSDKDRVAQETEVIKSAAVLWQMGLDYEKYLEKHGVIENDPWDKVFGNLDEEPEPLPDSEQGGMSLEQLLAGGEDD